MNVPVHTHHFFLKICLNKTNNKTKIAEGINVQGTSGTMLTSPPNPLVVLRC